MSSPELPQSMVSASKPVVVFGSIAAGATALVGVLASIPGVPVWLVAGVAGVAAVSTAVGAFLTTRKVTPWVDVAVKKTEAGELVAGPAAVQDTGTPVVVTNTEDQ